MRVITLEEAEKSLAEQMAYEARMEYGGRQRAEDYLLIAKAYFQNCPIIEAEPVKHGRWIYKGDDVFAGEYACSNCNGRAEVDLYGQWILSEFCSKCGARMEDK